MKTFPVNGNSYWQIWTSPNVREQRRRRTFNLTSEKDTPVETKNKLPVSNGKRRRSAKIIVIQGTLNSPQGDIGCWSLLALNKLQHLRFCYLGVLHPSHIRIPWDTKISWSNWRCFCGISCLCDFCGRSCDCCLMAHMPFSLCCAWQLRSIFLFH